MTKVVGPCDEEAVKAPMRLRVEGRWGRVRPKQKLGAGGGDQNRCARHRGIDESMCRKQKGLDGWVSSARPCLRLDAGLSGLIERKKVPTL